MKSFELRNRRYLGSKRAVLPVISQVIESLPSRPESAADLFAGTGVVGESLARAGMAVTFNDLLSSNTTIYRAFFGDGQVRPGVVAGLVDQINEARIDQLEENYFSETFAGSYYSESNSRLIGHYRERIDAWHRAGEITDREKAVLIASLIYGMDKAAATVGHYDAYREGAATDARLVFGLPVLEDFDAAHQITRLDANELVRTRAWDLVYIDPPYNSRQYGDLYHVLDNVADWSKPQVQFKARKMDRRHLKSDYCTTAAVPAFTDLIDSLDAEAIIMSYNDTGDRGNSRSAARLTDDDITSILARRGRVDVVDVPHREYTTGKSGIGEITERLFVCHVADTAGVSAPPAAARVAQSPAVRSPLNYTGNKKKLVDRIIPLLPAPDEQHRRFVDVFGGSMTVGMNAGYPSCVFNDLQPDVVALSTMFRDSSYPEIVARVEAVITDYGLTDSTKHGYEAYGANSSNGLGQVNKEAYLRLRDDFNAMDSADRRRPFWFFTLVVFGFNNQIRYNRSGQFNMPVGKRDFNGRVRKNLFDTVDRMHRLEPELWSLDFRDVFGKLQTTDLVYCDPPYILGTAPYNEQNAWTADDETDLLDELALFAERGGHFGLSNVIDHKGAAHDQLTDWATDHGFVVHTLDHSYANSSYHRKDREASTEVLITNWR
ncbi:MAG: Dam family site-specific DNA-(adenine-N6)-methyltransferase [Gordonia sp. (in: high G+C Gram-positive bacteria)]|uniref:Dam family site-specific DNA-(adenine-N6)-methyltransferase n=1 Tax=Gordonia sp. (in: high G+C Gram-positive bacteria) TaxID=84139 RepID=UPI0039E3A112